MLSGFLYLKKILETVPETPGIYQMYNDKARLLYIGKAKNLRKRLTSYTQEASLSMRIKRMIWSVTKVVIIETRSEAEALLLEVRLIQKHTPPYNIVFRDNKTLPRLCITKGDWPRLMRVRTRSISDFNACFGPFPSVKITSLTQNALQRIFLLRTCTDYTFKTRERPCLQYHIKRCSAPCVGKISQADYHKCVTNLVRVLKGKTGLVQQQLTQDMASLSKARRYEEAAQVRNRLQALLSLQQAQSLTLDTKNSMDFVGLSRDKNTAILYFLFIRDGYLLGSTHLSTQLQDEISFEDVFVSLLTQFYQKNPPPPTIVSDQSLSERAIFEAAMLKLYDLNVTLRAPRGRKELDVCTQAHRNAQSALALHKRHVTDTITCLKELGTLLGHKRPLNRIEIYDNSHLRGTHPYGAMVVATPNGWDKSAWRRIPIPTTYNGQDDYAMMRFMLERRLERLPWPDLIILDGGRGHYNAAIDILSRHKNPPLLMTIAKGDKRGRVRETFHGPQGPMDIPPGIPLYFYLERLRDEAHRFAHHAHTQKRQKSLRTSSFDDLPGVGAIKARALRETFGTIKELRNATVNQIAHVPGISPPLAKKIYEYLKNDD